jgi:hypothetical protein
VTCRTHEAECVGVDWLRYREGKLIPAFLFLFAGNFISLRLNHFGLELRTTAHADHHTSTSHRTFTIACTLCSLSSGRAQHFLQAPRPHSFNPHLCNKRGLDRPIHRRNRHYGSANPQFSRESDHHASRKSYTEYFIVHDKCQQACEGLCSPQMSGGNPGLDPATQGTIAQGMSNLRAFQTIIVSLR